jgi:hypothetical protein
MPQAFESVNHVGERKLQKNCTESSTEYDESCGGLKNLSQVSAFEQQSGNDAGDCEEDSNKA